MVAHGLPIRYVLNALDELDPSPLVEQVAYAEPYRLSRAELPLGQLVDGHGAPGPATPMVARENGAGANAGLITRTEDPNNGAQTIYAPTERAEALRPVLAAMADWALAYGPERLARPDNKAPF